MKNKKLVNLIIIALIIALIITAVIIKNTQANSNESSIVIDDEIVNEIQETNEIQDTTEKEKEETNIIQEKIVLENNEETPPEQEIITEKDIAIPKEEPKQTNVSTQEKKIDNSKKIEQSKTTQTTTTKQETQVQEQKIQEQPKQETKIEPLVKEPETPKCSDTKHGVGVGNSNKWFNSYNEAVSYYDNLINNYSNQVHSGEITPEEYNKKCPYGYETWSCPYCGKWTLNYYYR